MAHHLLGAPLVIEKKLVSNFFFGKNVYNMNGSLKYFSKFHHTHGHEHKQSPRHQQGLIGLI